MNYVKFNGTDLEVSQVCLGTVNYDTAMDKDASKKQMSQFLDLGGNFVDTAHIYGDWGGPELLCRSERVIGEWLKETGNRDKIILCTKGSHPDWGHMDISRLRAKDIDKDLHQSLDYLNTDYIDIYFLHRDDPNVPVSEIIDYLEKQRLAGKIRHYGCSNWALPRIKEAASYAEQTGAQGFICNQLMWSLADVNFDGLPDKTFILMDEEMHKYHEETGMNVMAYMSIAKGYFVRKAMGENLPASVTDVYDNTSNFAIYEKAKQLVDLGEYSFLDLSFMYIMAEKAFPSVPIASFDIEQHLLGCISTCRKDIPDEFIEELGKLKKFVY